jgi:DNA-binding NarL/FixJ family response regulator
MPISQLSQLSISRFAQPEKKRQNQEEDKIQVVIIRNGNRSANQILEKWQKNTVVELLLVIESVDSLSGYKKYMKVADVILFFCDFSQPDQRHALSLIKFKCPAIPFVIYSNSSKPADVVNSFEQGASGYFHFNEKASAFMKKIQKFMTEGLSPVSDDIVTVLVQMYQKPNAYYDAISLLSNKQIAVAQLLVSGCTYEEISARLQTNINITRYHIKQIYRKLNIRKGTQLMQILGGNIKDAPEGM